MRILLAQNKIAPARVVHSALVNAGMNVDLVDHDDEAIEYAQAYAYDLVIIDLNLSGAGGMATLRTLRARQNAAPVLVLSGNAPPETRVRALTAGADDCLALPYDSAEVVSRAQAIVRRSRGFCRSMLSAGNVTLDLGAREVAVDGTAVPLTAKEFALMELLMLRQGVAHSKQAFLNHLYGGLDEPDAKIIDVFICKLRRKLAQAGADNLISTVWGRGYMLRAAPEQVIPVMPVRAPAPVRFAHAA